MKTLLPYHFLILMLLLPTTLLGQVDKMLVKKVPFQNKDDEGIFQMIQDTTGLIWMISRDKWFTSDGEKIVTEPPPFQFTNKRTIYGSMNIQTPEGNFYLGGDSLRIFNPYSRRITKTIGLDDMYEIGEKRPNLWMFLPSSNNGLWAVLTSHSIDAENKLGKGNAILYSENGKPFKKVISTWFSLFSKCINKK